MTAFSNPDFDVARFYFNREAIARRIYNRIINRASAEYGANGGPLIACIVQEHWPEAIKARLRRLGYKVIPKYQRIGLRARPWRVHERTMHKLRASIMDNPGIMGEGDALETWSYEYTDTFSGEANYSWVRRGKVRARNEAHAIKLAKAACDLTGVRCDRDAGETVTLRPRGMCTVLFVNWHGNN